MTSQVSFDPVARRMAATEADFLREDQRFVLYGVPWDTYVALRDTLDESGSGLRMTYLEGTLELMSPSRNREDWLWEDGQLTVHRLTKQGYELQARSEVLPELDLEHLAGFVALDANQTQQVKAYRRSLRAQG